MTSRPSIAARYLTLALAAFALVVVPLGTYTTSYFLLGHRIEYGAYPGGPVLKMDRAYPQQWMPPVFRPAAKFEGWLHGIDVRTTWEAEYWHVHEHEHTGIAPGP